MNTLIIDKGSQASATVVNKGLQTEGIVDEVITVQVDETLVENIINQKEDEKNMQKMMQLSKGKDGHIRVLYGPAFVSFVCKEGVKCRSVARLKEPMQVHARTERDGLFPNRFAREYYACTWRNNKTWRIKRKEPTHKFVSHASWNRERPDFPGLENRKRRSMHVHEHIFPRPGVYVWRRKIKGG